MKALRVIRKALGQAPLTPLSVLIMVVWVYTVGWVLAGLVATAICGGMCL
jgi:hypothetical protein